VPTVSANHETEGGRRARDFMPRTTESGEGGQSRSETGARWLATLAAVAISATAYYVSTGLGEVWPAAWVAPVPVLVLAFESSRRRAAIAAGAAYLLGSLNMFTYAAEVMPLPMVVLFALIPSVVFAGAVLLARRAVQRLPAWLAVFAFPAAWTAYEFLESLASPHGTAGSIAYSQTDFLQLLQIASVTGIWGITFMLTLVPSAIAIAWARRSTAALAPAVVIGLAVLGFGALRLARAPEEPAVRVGLAATDRGIVAALNAQDPATALQVAHAYAGRIARAAQDGAQVVVLPEKFLGVTPGDSADVLQVFSDAARTAQVTVIAGLNGIDVTPRKNLAVVFEPDGSVATEYEKHHLLPGPETGYAVGTVPGLFQGPRAQWGVEICKDMDFPAWSREYAQRGVRLLAVPAWDFVRDGRWHSRMAVVRGVEEGFSLARSARRGLLTFSDAYGRVLGEASSAQLPDALLVRNLPAGPGSTLYTRFGNWFGWTSVILLALLLGLTRGAKG
jgi:apolipoprotein N-acyltransferase